MLRQETRFVERRIEEPGWDPELRVFRHGRVHPET